MAFPGLSRRQDRLHSVRKPLYAFLAVADRSLLRMVAFPSAADFRTPDFPMTQLLIETVPVSPSFRWTSDQALASDGSCH